MSSFSGRNWRRKFSDAWRGVRLAARREKSLAVQLAAAAGVLAIAAWLRITLDRWTVLLLAIALVLTAEYLNTGLEILSRAVADRPHPLLRDALDVSSGAVLLASLLAATIGLLVLGPPLWDRLHTWLLLPPADIH